MGAIYKKIREWLSPRQIISLVLFGVVSTLATLNLSKWAEKHGYDLLLINHENALIKVLLSAYGFISSDYMVGVTSGVVIMAFSGKLLPETRIVSSESIRAINGSRKGAPQIEIFFEKRAPYEVSDIQGEHVLSTVRIGVRNSGDAALSNCTVYIEKISPLPALYGGLPILLQEGKFAIREDDPEKLVDIAFHWDNHNRYRFNSGYGTFAETYNFLPDNVTRTIVIKVAASECQRSASFKIWSDADRKLRLEFIGYTT